METSAVFRQDINALRAWAVIAVVGYHFGFTGFTGGFVGVDIFFVISGYLITGQALDQLEKDRFSFFAFWTARLRRIFPALLIVLLATISLGWLLTMPYEYLSHTRQMLFAATFLSNITFASQQGYFDAVAHTKPLLHTWSLSIEWQFYFLLPFVLVTVWHFSAALRRQRNLLLGMTAITLVSMLWCFWLSQTGMGESFFSLRARAWELLLGGVIASTHRTGKVFSKKGVARSLWEARARPLAAIAGWGLLALTTLASLSPGRWPGPLTLLPVVGAGLIVWGHTLSAFGLSRVVNCWPAQRIGDWSYSIYLWHWPLWVFMQQWASARGHTIEVHQKIELLLTVLVLSCASYHYIEKPVRINRDKWTARRLGWCYLLALLILSAFTVAAVQTHGFEERVPAYQQRAELAKRLNTPRDECFRNSKSEKLAPTQFCDFGSLPDKQKTTAMLWGDSVAEQFLVPITAAATKLGIHGLIATQSGCRALLIEKPGIDNNSKSCAHFNQEVVSFLGHQVDPRIVILGRNWGNSAASVDEVFTLVQYLLLSGRTVVLILPMLNLNFDVPQRWIGEQLLAGKPVEDIRIKMTPELVYQQARDALAMRSREFADNPKLITVDLLPKICADGFCYLVRDGQANFRDTLHISNINASQYESLFVSALQKAVSAAALQKPAPKGEVQ